MLQAPVVTYRRGRGVVPTTHPLAVSLPVGQRLWKRRRRGAGRRHAACISPSRSWGTDPDLKIVRLDIDAEEITRFRRPDAAVLADAADGLRALLAALPAHNRARAPREDVAAAQAWFAERMARHGAADGLPARAARRAARGRGGGGGRDPGEFRAAGWPSRWRRRAATSRRATRTIWAGATGRRWACRRRCPTAPWWRSAAMAGSCTRRRNWPPPCATRLPVVAVVFDDGAFGNVRRIQAEHFGNRLIACDLANPDFYAFARSFGANAFRASDEASLRVALREALAARAPALVHVKVGEMPSPWDMLAPRRVRGQEGWRLAAVGRVRLIVTQKRGRCAIGAKIRPGRCPGPPRGREALGTHSFIPCLSG